MPEEFKITIVQYVRPHGRKTMVHSIVDKTTQDAVHAIQDANLEISVEAIPPNHANFVIADNHAEVDLASLLVQNDERVTPEFAKFVQNFVENFERKRQ